MEDKIDLDEFAKKLITEKIKKVMQKHPDIQDEEDIKVLVETEILMPLTQSNISKEQEKQIMSIMQKYDTIFYKIYSIIEKEQMRRNEEGIGER